MTGFLPEPQPSACLEEDISGAHRFQLSFYFYLFLICFWLVENFFYAGELSNVTETVFNLSFYWLSV